MIELLECAQYNLAREEALLHAHACFSPHPSKLYRLYGEVFYSSVKAVDKSNVLTDSESFEVFG